MINIRYIFLGVNGLMGEEAGGGSLGGKLGREAWEGEAGGEVVKTTSNKDEGG